MKVLLLDTATDQLVAGVGTVLPTRLIASEDGPAPRSSNVQLISRLQKATGKDSLAGEHIDAIVCGVGPGSFTGVRIGVSTAKGLAQGTGANLWGVPTPEAIAWRFAKTNFTGTLGVVQDAMRGEVYPVLFRIQNGKAQRLTPHRVCKPEVLIEDWTSKAEEIFLAGDGLYKYQAILVEGLAGVRVAPEHLWAPSSQGLLDAFAHLYKTHSCFSVLEGDGRPEVLAPIYTRLSDAEENEKDKSNTSEKSLKSLPPFPLTKEDVPEVIELEQKCFQIAQWTEGMLRDEFSREDRAWICMRALNGEMLGFAGAQVIDGDAHILNIVVAPPARKQGVGRKLINSLAQEVRQLDANQFTLEVNEHNEDAIAFYESLGFEEEGKRSNYYSDGAAALIMFGPLSLGEGDSDE